MSAFAVWLTGLPASGKSTIAAALRTRLLDRGINVAVLESDQLRKIFTPHPRYDDEERETFYRQMVYVGELLIQHGVSVIFDGTANRRAYRDQARAQIPRFLEVYVECPLEICMSRDPKGIYRKAREAGTGTVPGLQSTYEPPENPRLTVLCDRETAEEAAQRIMDQLANQRFLQPKRLAGA